jgi:ABC-type transport system involved in cytochrome c biogenesis permease subunit
MKRLFPIFSVVDGGVLLAYALYQALVVAPTDAQQGEVYRIIYYHVPSAWTAFLLFFINFIASIQYLAQRKAFRRSGREVDRDRGRGGGRDRVFCRRCSG